MDLILADHPSHATAHMYRAAACMRLDDMATASRHLARALNLDPMCANGVAGFAREAVKREPGNTRVARVLAEALVLCNDRAGAARCLDEALETGEGRADVELILARRSIALMEGDKAEARGLLARAETAATNRDDLLAKLHHEAMTRERPGRTTGTRATRDDEIAAAVARGDYFLAGELASSTPASPRKVWILERCGRPVEAAACLREIMHDQAAATRFATLHDRFVARDLEGRAELLIAETVLEFDRVNSGEDVARPAPDERLSEEAVEGGGR